MHFSKNNYNSSSGITLLFSILLHVSASTYGHHRPNAEKTEPNTQQTRRNGKEKDTSQKNHLQHVKTTFQEKDSKTPPRNATKEKQHRQQSIGGDQMPKYEDLVDNYRTDIKVLKASIVLCPLYTIKITFVIANSRSKHIYSYFYISLCPCVIIINWKHILHNYRHNPLH
jgi:hypothetical protein